MKNNWIMALLAVVMVVMVSACGGGSSSNNGSVATAANATVTCVGKEVNAQCQCDRLSKSILTGLGELQSAVTITTTFGGDLHNGDSWPGDISLTISNTGGSVFHGVYVKHTIYKVNSISPKPIDSSFLVPNTTVPANGSTFIAPGGSPSMVTLATGDSIFAEIKVYNTDGMTSIPTTTTDYVNIIPDAVGTMTYTVVP